MNNEREVFLNRMNNFIALSKYSNKKDFKLNYLELVKEYHPDKNNKIDKNTLNEYMIIINNTYNNLRKNSRKINVLKKQNDSKYFYIIVFCELLSRIKKICKPNDEIKGPNFVEHKNLIINEISKYDLKVSEAFSLLITQKTIEEKKFDSFQKGLDIYEKIFRNTYTYTEYYSKKLQETGKNYLENYKNNNTQEKKAAIEIIIKWFDGIIKSIQ